jgi:predicted Zn-dependent peptidase
VPTEVEPAARFRTAVRVVFHRDLGPEATATSLLGAVLESATERHPSREALAHRLADLYGAGLDVGVEKLGDRQTLTASLDWPTRGIPGRGATLSDGLSFLREVLATPKRGPDGALDADLVATEASNLRRALEALKNDKARYAARRCLEAACAGEAYALDPEGRLEDLPAATPRALADLHTRLLATAPAEIFVAGDLGWEETKRAVRTRLLWPGRGRVAANVPPVTSVRPARARPRRIVERDRVAQGKLAMAWRAPIRGDSGLVPAAQVLAGVLGGTSVARFFKVVRETHGLCYYASAGWARAKGLMLVQSGVEPANEPKARRLILELVREAASGTLDPQALEAVREASMARVRAMRDERGLAIAFAHEMAAFGLSTDPAVHRDALLAVRPADVRRVGRALRLDTTFFLTSDGRPSAGAASDAAHEEDSA